MSVDAGDMTQTLTRALQGDEDAIAAVAARLSGPPVNPVAQKLAAIHRDVDNRRLRDQHQKDHADIWEREPMRKMLFERQAALVAGDSSMAFGESLEQATYAVYEKYGSGHEFDSSAAVKADPRRKRQLHDDAAESEVEPSEEELQRRETIAAMAASRRPRPIEEIVVEDAD